MQEVEDEVKDNRSLEEYIALADFTANSGDHQVLRLNNRISNVASQVKFYKLS